MARALRRRKLTLLALCAALAAAVVTASGCGSPTAEQAGEEAVIETTEAPEEAATEGTEAAGTAPVEGTPAPAAAAPGTAAPEPAAAAPPDTDWTGTAQKWVPIFSLEREGARVGAAQVAGPTAQVAKVKGVAELRLRFKDIGRIYAYIPVSEISLTRQKRVQGVSVWAIGDIELVDF
jgi:hypothetical protein